MLATSQVEINASHATEWFSALLQNCLVVRGISYFVPVALRAVGETVALL